MSHSFYSEHYKISPSLQHNFGALGLVIHQYILHHFSKIVKVYSSLAEKKQKGKQHAVEF